MRITISTTDTTPVGKRGPSAKARGMIDGITDEYLIQMVAKMNLVDATFTFKNGARITVKGKVN